MSIEVRVGDPEMLIAGFEDREIIDAILDDPQLRSVAPSLDVAAVRRATRDPEWEPTLLPGAFQDVDTVSIWGVDQITRLMSSGGFDDVAEALATMRAFFVPGEPRVTRVGPVRIVAQQRLRQAIAAVAHAIGYGALGNLASGAYAIGDVPFNLEVMRHALDQTGEARWIHWGG